MYTIDNKIIKQLGLRISNKPINAQIAPGSRIFDYPHLENVFVMESDLYGNTMPENSCFLAFEGNHGLIGKHLSVEVLAKSSVAEIRHIVETNVDS